MWDTIKKARLVIKHAGFARTAQRTLQRTVPPWLFDLNCLLATEVDLATLQMPTVDPA